MLSDKNSNTINDNTATPVQTSQVKTKVNIDANIDAWRQWSGFAPEKRIKLLKPLLFYFGQDTDELITTYINWQNGQKLPAFTGESNQLKLVGRGVFVAIGENVGAAVLTALAFGNSVLWAAPGAASKICKQASSLQLPSALITEISDNLPQIISNSDIAGVLFGGSRDNLALVRQNMARRNGAIVPLIIANDFDPRADFYLVAHERTLTINTAAAGGNAELMAITDD